MMPCTRQKMILLAVCTRDRMEVLQNCLRTVSKLAEPSDSEIRVMVIDNSAAAEIREKNKAVVHAIRWPWPITIDYEPQTGISLARNRGLEHALAISADAIVFIDDDQTVPEDWLAVLVRAWREEGADAMQTKVVKLPREQFELYDGRAIQDLQRLHVTSRRNADVKTLGTGGVLISRCLFEELGMRFDPAFALTGGEDRDFFYRARLRGARRLAITYETIAFEWRPPSRRNLIARVTQGFRIGVNNARLRQLRGQSSASCLRRGLWMVVSGLLTIPAFIWFPSKLQSRAKRMAEGAGLLAGLAGYRFEYYRTVPE
jgi:succinoglycan biosynthesis protein ExoM